VWAWGAEALEEGSAPVEWAPFAECLFGAALDFGLALRAGQEREEVGD